MAKKKKKEMNYVMYLEHYNYLKRQGYKLNGRMSKVEFNYRKAQAKADGMNSNEINKLFRQNMYETTYKQANAARNNLFENLNKMRGDEHQSAFQAAVVEKADEYGINPDELLVSGMRKAYGPLQNFLDDVNELAAFYGIEHWTDTIFGS